MKKKYIPFVSFLAFNAAVVSFTVAHSDIAHAGMINIATETMTQSENPQNYEITTAKDDSSDQPIILDDFTSDAYSFKQCTWWVYNRAKEFGINYGTTMGNGGDWQLNSDYVVTTTPQLHSAVSFSPGQIVGGQWQADPTYGHVAFVEAIHPDGSILISQSGLGFSEVVNYQEISSSDALQLHYVIGKQ